MNQEQIEALRSKVDAERAKRGPVEPEPRFGMGATLCYPTDRRPYVIIHVTKTTVDVLPVSTEGLEPDGKCNGFPVYDHRFDVTNLMDRAEPGAARAFRDKSGRYHLGGIRLAIGYAHYYRNYAD